MLAVEWLQVYEGCFTETGIREEVALKVIDVPGSIHDPCYQVRADGLPSLHRPDIVTELTRAKGIPQPVQCNVWPSKWPPSDGDHRLLTEPL